MDLVQSGVLVVYALSTVFSLILGGAVWRYREKPGAIPLAAALFAAALWAGPLFIATAVDSPTVSAFMHRVLYVGVGATVLSGFLFVLEYTGREHLVTRRTVALLSVEPVLVVALALWNPGSVFFTRLEPDPAVVTGVAVEFGPAFDAHLLYSYLLILIGAGMILELLYNSRALYRGQAAALLGALFVPLPANAIYISDVTTVDTTPIGFILASTLYAIAIIRYRLIDIEPIARHHVLDTISEGVFIFDRDDRLVDVNPAGRRLTDGDGDDDDDGNGGNPATLIGRSIESLFPETPAVRELYIQLTATVDEHRDEIEIAGSHYDIRATPIDDGRDRHVGWLVIVSDITGRKRYERQLEQQNERLNQFASIVSHDLRNPLNIADGYVALARETGDISHLDDVEQSHDRMQTIIDDVLALAREGETVTDSKPVELTPLAERTWETVETGTARLDVRSSARIQADPDRLQRLLENLFRNSVEHGSTGSRSKTDDTVEHGAGRDTPRTDGVDCDSPDGQTATHDSALVIAVGLERDDPSGATFYVEDNGPGIPSSRREQVFESGYTIDGDGSGLGLQIVEQIADAHGWSTTVTEGPMGGARFEVTGLEMAGEPPEVDAERRSR